MDAARAYPNVKKRRIDIMRIGFIGAGKVATAFGRYLHTKEIAVSGYFDRHIDKVDHAAQVTESAACKSAVEVAACSDVILITTRDDQISGACESLCRDGGIAEHHCVGHMSGAHASDILSAAQQHGAAVFSLHPLQAFADEAQALVELPGTFFSLEGRKEQLQKVEDILVRIGNPYFTITAQNKSLYHLSACILSNYLVTLMDCGLTAMEKSGIDPRQGFHAMRPLIEGTLANIAEMGTAEALTGPIARGDSGTIRQHLKALDHQGLDEIKSIYTFMGSKTLDLATRKILQSAEKVDAVRALLV
jgi:predicted short-subunit dehydrogenase-like oxidoreductase (DUF2520 family)